METKTAVRTFQIKLDGEVLNNIETLSADRFRSVTKQILKLIDEFIAKNVEVEIIEQ